MFTLLFFHSQSQSEFDIDGDMSSNEVVKQRAKDPMRPKSPRHMRTNSGDIPKPGALERSVVCGTQSSQFIGSYSKIANLGDSAFFKKEV